MSKSIPEIQKVWLCLVNIPPPTESNKNGEHGIDCEADCIQFWCPPKVLLSPPEKIELRYELAEGEDREDDEVEVHCVQNKEAKDDITNGRECQREEE